MLLLVKSVWLVLACKLCIPLLWAPTFVGVLRTLFVWQLTRRNGLWPWIGPRGSPLEPPACCWALCLAWEVGVCGHGRGCCVGVPSLLVFGGLRHLHRRHIPAGYGAHLTPLWGFGLAKCAIQPCWRAAGTLQEGTLSRGWIGGEPPLTPLVLLGFGGLRLCFYCALWWVGWFVAFGKKW